MTRSRRHAGLGLIELMVALAVGGVIIASMLAVHAHVQSAYRVSERVARLQEAGRVALSVIAPDVELAGYYGFTNDPATVRLVRGASAAVTLATATQMRQYPVTVGGAPPAPVVGLPPGAHTCGINFAVDVMMPVQGANGAFALGRGGTCTPYQNRAQAGADTLTIRRAETQATSPEIGGIQIYATRAGSRTDQLMFVDGHAPGMIDEAHRVHNLVVRAYYVARDSVGRPGLPALRVKTLTRSGSALLFRDDEIMPGVEDLQVQFAVAAEGESARAIRYVNPDFGELPWLRVVAVRLWLRVRSDEREPGFEDHATYRYADVVFEPAGAEREFRRVLISRTVAVRNARWR